VQFQRRFHFPIQLAVVEWLREDRDSILLEPLLVGMEI